MIVTVPAVCVNVPANIPKVAVPPYVKLPEVKVKPVVGLIVPLVKLNDGPLITNVVHAIVPIFDNVPPV